MENPTRRISYPTPSEILLQEFLKPMPITQYRLAKEIGVPQRRIGEIVAGKRGITTDTGLRLTQFFGTSEGFWTGPQDDHDRAMTKDVIAETLRRITPWNARRAAQPRPADRLRASPRSSRTLGVQSFQRTILGCRCSRPN
nr:HigA family addiction module antitoxin [Metallibacterium sp.]